MRGRGLWQGVAMAGMVGLLVPVRVGDVEVLVETVPVPGSERMSGRLGEAGRRVVEAFGRAQAAIVEIASQVAGAVGVLGQRAARPDKVGVEFGLSFTAQGGVVVARASAEASLRVTVSYERAAGPAAGPAVPVSGG
jgi:hypothetical protein